MHFYESAKAHTICVMCLESKRTVVSRSLFCSFQCIRKVLLRKRGIQKGVAQMAWEDRNGRMYYYRKRREGKHVVSEYMGAGLAGQIAEIFDMEDREEVEYKRAEFREQKALAQTIDSQARDVEKYTKVTTRAYLLLAGYHTHKRHWRKRRNDGNNENNN